MIVGNLSFNLITPILRRLLSGTAWNEAILITQWEVVRAIFGGRGNTFARIVQNATRLGAQETGQASRRTGIDRDSLPRDLTASQWAGLWTVVRT
ncbi:hypothetical protein [Kribbella solani]|uniref:Uncharacterized membrane protein YuzA (DUF378 family) n=1 Tax=Kribbella solani TaxID=236067 RepID=A0A841DJV1_9ACTN|nr:hypothetical protein [Kribbella solani]MBB5977355.1 uncharacterized membrane protein YuzA (DUF378 family) [Kribbella solani]